jgi:hypothetical protein
MAPQFSSAGKSLGARDGLLQGFPNAAAEHQAGWRRRCPAENSPIAERGLLLPLVGSLDEYFSSTALPR